MWFLLLINSSLEGSKRWLGVGSTRQVLVKPSLGQVIVPRQTSFFHRVLFSFAILLVKLLLVCSYRIEDDSRQLLP